MKAALILPFLILFLVPLAWAQQPEQIYGKNRILHPNHYYLEQMDLWQKETQRDPQNANAWYNYYRSNRNAYIVGEENDSLNTKGINRFSRLNIIVTQMEKEVPGSYEYHFVKWLNGNSDMTLFTHLEKAYDLQPQKSEVLLSLAYCYEISGDSIKRNQYLREFYALGDYSPGMLNYTYNLIIGLDENAIIFTEGDKDTDCILILQQGMGIRKDIQMLNLNLLLIPEYRARIFAELEIDSLDYDPLENDANFERYSSTIIAHVSKNKGNRPVYVAATVSDPYTGSVSNQLYIEGLASKYSKRAYNNIAILEKNYEQLYALDYIQVRFTKDLSEGWVLNFNQHYLESLGILYDYYVSKEDESKAEYYYSQGYKIAVDANELELFDIYFNAE